MESSASAATIPPSAPYDRENIEYDLVVRQQPRQARMCGVGVAADRRPIDPPPIIQLRVRHKHSAAQGDHTGPTAAGSSSQDLAEAGYVNNYLQNPYYFMYASLAKESDDTEMHWLKDGKTCSTTGSVVSSLYHLKDSENSNEDAGFFVFPDLSVRTEGSYRLKLSLFEVVGSNVHHCKSIFTNAFYVYTAKKFPGMEESTSLSCSLADQGIKIRIRKDIRIRKRPAAPAEDEAANLPALDSGPALPVPGPVVGTGFGFGTGPLPPPTGIPSANDPIANTTARVDTPVTGRRPRGSSVSVNKRSSKRSRTDEESAGEPASPSPAAGSSNPAQQTTWSIDPALSGQGSPPNSAPATTQDYNRGSGGATAYYPPPPVGYTEQHQGGHPPHYPPPPHPNAPHYAPHGPTPPGYPPAGVPPYGPHMWGGPVPVYDYYQPYPGHYQHPPRPYDHAPPPAAPQSHSQTPPSAPSRSYEGYQPQPAASTPNNSAQQQSPPNPQGGYPGAAPSVPPTTNTAPPPPAPGYPGYYENHPGYGPPPPQGGRYEGYPPPPGSAPGYGPAPPGAPQPPYPYPPPPPHPGYYAYGAPGYAPAGAHPPPPGAYGPPYAGYGYPQPAPVDAWSTVPAPGHPPPPGAQGWSAQAGAQGGGMPPGVSGVAPTSMDPNVSRARYEQSSAQVGVQGSPRRWDDREVRDMNDPRPVIRLPPLRRARDEENMDAEHREGARHISPHEQEGDVSDRRHSAGGRSNLLRIGNIISDDK